MRTLDTNFEGNGFDTILTEPEQLELEACSQAEFQEPDTLPRCGFCSGLVARGKHFCDEACEHQWELAREYC